MQLSQEARSHLKGFQVVDEPLPRDGAVILDLAVESFGPLRKENISPAAFKKWVASANYNEIDPRWEVSFAKNLTHKYFEHYTSIVLVGMKPGGVYMDAASSGSPFYKGVKRSHNVTCYRQDLNHPAGVRGDTIGSNASSIPLPDRSLDGIVSHNSWEHFEGDSALDFIRECARLLKPGAKLCITPINFAMRMEIRTSPSCWTSKYRNAPELPKFDPRATIVIEEDIIQRQVLYWRPDMLKHDLDLIENMSFELLTARHESISHYVLVGTRT